MTHPTAGDNAFERICRSAVKIFSSRGYHKTTMDDIAAAAGLTKGAIYWHFKNKKELFKFLITSRYNEFDELITSALSSSSPPPVKILKAFWNSADYFENNREFCALVKVFHSEGIVITDSEFEETLRSLYSRYRELIAAVIREGIDEGHFSPDISPEIAGSLILAAFDGLSFQWLVDPQAFTLKDALPLLNRIVDKGFAAKDGAAE
ncbi:MAG TPA: TetR/AcrR family transcriptional regulator [Bacillota bacterium]|nr:TetR/AcrR family transcriptional regulator [Bacillota bacterium]